MIATVGFTQFMIEVSRLTESGSLNSRLAELANIQQELFMDESSWATSPTEDVLEAKHSILLFVNHLYKKPMNKIVCLSEMMEEPSETILMAHPYFVGMTEEASHKFDFLRTTAETIAAQTQNEDEIYQEP